LHGGRNDRLSSQAVPNVSQVVSGAFVSIVLKIDQPTGREVQGVVADVLTNGNHPRGIKVRLVDGRIGRVQRMVSEEEARAGSESLSSVGRNGEGSNAQVSSAPAAPRSRITNRYRNVREEEETELPPSEYSLGDLLPPDHPLHESPTPAAGMTRSGSVIHKCPVCAEFEGDEVAVSHHVAEHFD